MLDAGSVVPSGQLNQHTVPRPIHLPPHDRAREGGVVHPSRWMLVAHFFLAQLVPGNLPENVDVAPPAVSIGGATSPF